MSCRKAKNDCSEQESTADGAVLHVGEECEMEYIKQQDFLSMKIAGRLTQSQIVPNHFHELL